MGVGWVGASGVIWVRVRERGRDGGGGEVRRAEGGVDVVDVLRGEMVGVVVRVVRTGSLDADVVGGGDEEGDV